MVNLDSTGIATILLIASLVSTCALGLVVLLREPHRTTHRFFAGLCANLALWTLGVLVIAHSHDEHGARLAIMLTFAVATFLPATFYHFIAYFPSQQFTARYTVLGFLYSGAVLLILSMGSGLYIYELKVYPDAPPQVVYGPVFHSYGILVLVSMFASFSNLVYKVRQASGINRRQIEHVLAGIFLSTVFASSTNVLAPALGVGSMELYGPCFVLILVAILAYSMIRYHLLDIWFMVSRTTVYAIMTSVVVGIFTGSVWFVHYFFSGGQMQNLLTTLIAAVLVVLVLGPLKDRLQRLLDRLVLQRHYDTKALIERISRGAVTMVQLENLLQTVVCDIQRTVGVPAVRVLLVEGQAPDSLVVTYSTREREQGNRIGGQGYLLQHIQEHHGPMALQALRHTRVSAQDESLIRALEKLDAFLLAPLVTQQGVMGVLCLGEKTSRDIYTQEDLHVFTTIAGPLSAAIENARLYDRLEALNVHMERIMHNMRGAVVAVDRAGLVSTLNQEATDLCGDVSVGARLSALPQPVAELLERTLSEQRGINDLETHLKGDTGELVPVVMSSSYFEGGASEKLGAMVLIYNMTVIKLLEANVQRADRLTSIGTLAAGMAHEIKNPLQSIKTFTQLLLNRFDDSDFRKTFSEVVPPEVQRIDGIVSRLLDFARPKPVHFAPQDLRKTIQAVLALIENQLRKHNILVTTEFPEDCRRIMGDEQQLHQVFLNLMLNAVDALKDSDERRINIRAYYARAHIARAGRPTLTDVPCTRVIVSDTGCGIAEDDLPQLFNPFFTTKAHGSGLGLSVVHGILTDHNAQIDVSSVPGQGTSFSISFPLMEREELMERVRV